MVTAIMTKTAGSSLPAVKQKARLKVTIFHCFNSLMNTEFLDESGYEVESIKMPCSSLNREVVLLRAFEAGADAVMVLACPLGSCHYIQGNLRAAKRVARVQKILDEIGIDGRRLSFFNIPAHDSEAVTDLVIRTLDGLQEIGPLHTRP
jgi:F420-non-reducing hydrogenase iron-sulfur subunit